MPDRAVVCDGMREQETLQITLTREQADMLRLHADGEAATYTRLAMHPFSPDAEARKHLDLWEAIFDATTDAIAAQLRALGEGDDHA